MKRAVVGALLLSLSTRAAAQAPPVTAIPPGPDKITPLAAGDKAPFGGQLFDTPTALRWANWLEQYRVRLKLDVEAQQQLDQVQIDLLTKKLDLERAQYQTVTLDYQKQVAALQTELRDPPWYKSPLFGFTIGVVGTIAIVGVTAYALHAVK
jgi:hypothetical protein